MIAFIIKCKYYNQAQYFVLNDTYYQVFKSSYKFLKVAVGLGIYQFTYPCTHMVGHNVLCLFLWVG